MSATSYSKNLGLCLWSETDRPKRMDFVNDNNIIDETVGGHIADSNVHVTQAEKELYSTPYKVVTYAGTGASTRTIPLDKEYTFAMVFQKDSPVVATDSQGNTVMHFAVVGRVFGSNANLTLTSSGLEVVQDTSANDGVINNFNQQYGQYVIVLFR